MTADEKLDDIAARLEELIDDTAAAHGITTSEAAGLLYAMLTDTRPPLKVIQYLERNDNRPPRRSTPNE